MLRSTSSSQPSQQALAMLSRPAVNTWWDSGFLLKITIIGVYSKEDGFSVMVTSSKRLNRNPGFVFWGAYIQSLSGCLGFRA